MVDIWTNDFSSCINNINITHKLFDDLNNFKLNLAFGPNILSVNFVHDCCFVFAYLVNFFNISVKLDYIFSKNWKIIYFSNF